MSNFCILFVYARIYIYIYIYIRKNIDFFWHYPCFFIFYVVNAKNFFAYRTCIALRAYRIDQKKGLGFLLTSFLKRFFQFHPLLILNQWFQTQKSIYLEDFQLLLLHNGFLNRLCPLTILLHYRLHKVVKVNLPKFVCVNWQW